MLFVPSAREDIGKYFLNSFLKFKETGDTMFFLRHVDSTCISGQVDDGRDFKLYLAEEEPYEVDYILPHKSFFQYGEHAAMLQRIPAKQYHRGITAENTAVLYRRGDDKELGVFDLGFDVLKNFVKKKQFFTLSQAMKEPLQSAALAPRMMYARGSRSVYMDFIPIARVRADNKILMRAPIFKQELEDFLKATQETGMFTFSGTEKMEKP